MSIILDIFNFLVAHGSQIVSLLVGLLTAIIAICLLIPGDQPEKFLQGVVDFLSKFSAKP